MLYLLFFSLQAELNLGNGFVITKIEQISNQEIHVHIKDLCIIALNGNYTNTNENNFYSTLKRNNLTKQNLINTIQNFRAQKMCSITYNDNEMEIDNAKIKVFVNWPFFASYSAKEKYITKGPQLYFPLSFSENIEYQAFTGYRIYLPKGTLRGIVFDIYGGGMDRLYYPYSISSDEVSSSNKNLITQYKNFFRSFLDHGVAVITLRLADCRLQIKDPLRLEDKNKPFLCQSNQKRLLLKHQAFYEMKNEITILKKEIKNFLDQLPTILPESQNLPKIFLGMSFGGIIGLCIVQDPHSENWFDQYILMQTPTYEFKGVVGDTIYDVLEKMTYLQKPIFFLFGENDARIGDGHGEFFLKKIKDQSLVKISTMKNVGHEPPKDPRVIEEILEYCGVS